MSLPSSLNDFLIRVENLAFPENQDSLTSIRAAHQRFIASHIALGTLWHQPESIGGLRVLIEPAGHVVVYGEHGARVLYADPAGTILHECAWEVLEAAVPRLRHARLRLDWGQWVGLKSEGMEHTARFDISKKPGWQRLTRADLHRMAAQAMGVTTDEVAFFYDDQHLVLDTVGQVTITHRKDTLYALHGRGFDQAQFMACMGAMHWGQIDFLPVVELFQSLLPGTGSAVFELIRGLYDDQNQEGQPRLLRYRGIPTYPSPQAFQLFSTYFVPETPERADPFAVFMEPTRSAEVLWRPRPDVPRRFIDEDQGLCITVAAGSVQKVTRRDDPVALPYARPKGRNLPAGGRMVGATKNVVLLQDGKDREEIPIKQEWGITNEAPLSATDTSQGTWRNLFPEGVPKVNAIRAYFTVPMYPEEDAPVEELATQPLALERILEYADGINAGEMLIDEWDAVIAECLQTIQLRSCLVLYARPEFAQRQAQRVWDYANGSGNLTKLQNVQFVAVARRSTAYNNRYSLIVRWLPYTVYTEITALQNSLNEITRALLPHSHAIIAGPSHVAETAAHTGFEILASSAIADTEGARALLSILPQARIRPDANVFLLRKHNH